LIIIHITDFAAFTYFISIVPTIYVDRHGNSLVTNQYAITEFKKEMPESPDPRRNLIPGVFFKYEIEPILVRITESHQSMWAFLIRVFGVLGGIWSITGFLHNAALAIMTTLFGVHIPHTPLKDKASDL
jgi:hypothetical protein